MFTDVLTVLFVADIERSMALYRDGFGMTETYRFPREGVPEHVELRLGTTTLGLSSPAGLVREGLPPATRGTPFELAFGNDDTDVSLERLRAAGFRVLRKPYDSDAGNRVAYVEDFDGNRISIYSRRT
jgi:catechol 2,3-dioxygenase-like lactoylglutathione lyase family enzyme